MAAARRGVVCVSIGSTRIPGGTSEAGALRSADPRSASSQACRITVAARSIDDARAVAGPRRRPPAAHARPPRWTGARPAARRAPAGPRGAPSANASACCARARARPTCDRGCPTTTSGRVVLARRARRPPSARPAAGPTWIVPMRHRQPPVGVGDRDADPRVAEVEAEHAAAGAPVYGLVPITSRAPRSSCEARRDAAERLRRPRSACLPPAFARMSLPPAPPPITLAAVARAARAR